VICRCRYSDGPYRRSNLGFGPLLATRTARLFIWIDLPLDGRYCGGRSENPYLSFLRRCHKEIRTTNQLRIRSRPAYAGTNMAIEISSVQSSNLTFTGMPNFTLSGEHPMMLVRRFGPSSSFTSATT
jgi:hypothetical protein